MQESPYVGKLHTVLYLVSGISKRDPDFFESLFCQVIKLCLNWFFDIQHPLMSTLLYVSYRTVRSHIAYIDSVILQACMYLIIAGHIFQGKGTNFIRLEILYIGETAAVAGCRAYSQLISRRMGRQVAKPCEKYRCSDSF